MYHILSEIVEMRLSIECPGGTHIQRGQGVFDENFEKSP